LISIPFSKYYGSHLTKLVVPAVGLGENEKCVQNFSRNLKERDNCGDQGVEGRLILKWNLKK
jgi:hypothetical protein